MTTTWDIIQAELARYHVPQSVAAPIIMQESSGNPRAAAGGAYGLLGLQTGTGQGAGHSTSELEDPTRNLEIGLPKIAAAVDQATALGMDPHTEAFLDYVAERSGHNSEIPSQESPDYLAAIGRWFQTPGYGASVLQRNTSAGGPYADPGPGATGPQWLGSTLGGLVSGAGNAAGAAGNAAGNVLGGAGNAAGNQLGQMGAGMMPWDFILDPTGAFSRATGATAGSAVGSAVGAWLRSNGLMIAIGIAALFLLIGAAKSMGSVGDSSEPVRYIKSGASSAAGGTRKAAKAGALAVAL